MAESKYWKHIRQLSWKELLVGLLLSALFSPVLATVVTPAYASLGVFGTPQIDSEVEVVDSIYTEGMVVEKFGNITWEDDYEVYRVRFRNEGEPTLSRAVFEVRFPGCIKETSGIQASEGNGPITVSAPLRPEIQATERPDAEVLGCTIQISTENIHTHEGYTLEFVVEHEFSKCDLLSAYNPMQTYFIEYEWNANGQGLSERLTGQIRGADSQFQDVQLPANSTKLTQREDYSAFLYGVGNGDRQRAIEICYE